MDCVNRARYDTCQILQTSKPNLTRIHNYSNIEAKEEKKIQTIYIEEVQVKIYPRSGCH